jgi:excinuclease ABC subunit B
VSLSDPRCRQGRLPPQPDFADQTAGRAARHLNGEVVLFADTVTQSMQALISISDYRRTKQMEYNEKHGITPKTVTRAIQESLHTILKGREIARPS